MNKFGKGKADRVSREEGKRRDMERRKNRLSRENDRWVMLEKIENGEDEDRNGK